MTPWKEHHYARADEFVRLVAAALARAGGSAEAGHSRVFVQKHPLEKVT